MTERSESERAELVALADWIERSDYLVTPGIDQLKKIVTALRRLAAQDQKPPQDAGWDEKSTRDIRWLVSSARACLRHFNPCNLAEDKSQQWQSLSHQCDVVERALRHNAPPDSGAGKSVLVANDWSVDDSLLLKKALSNCGISSPTSIETLGIRFIRYVRDVVRIVAERGCPSPLPDHGGADAGVGVKPLEWLSDTKPFFAGTRFCTYRISQVDDGTWETAVSYRGPRCWHHQTEAEAKAAAQADYERRILSTLSKPAPVAANASAELSKFANDLAAKQEPLGVQISSEDLESIYIRSEPSANASAEAQLRKALEQIIRYCDESTDPVIALTAKKALSTHPHASDCDKQEERK